MRALIILLLHPKLDDAVHQCRPLNNDGNDYACDGKNVTEWKFDSLPEQLNK